MRMFSFFVGTIANQTGATECIFCDSGRYQPSLGKVEWYLASSTFIHFSHPSSLYAVQFFHQFCLILHASLYKPQEFKTIEPFSLVRNINLPWCCIYSTASNVSRENLVRLSGLIACSAKPVILEIHLIFHLFILYAHEFI
jgi:hypothetical protein